MSEIQKPTQRILESLPSDLRELVSPSVPLGDLTTLGIGGPAALVCHIRNAEHAQRFQAFCSKENLPSAILGGGSNILAADAGFPGLILKIATDRFTVGGETLTAGAGLDFDLLIRRSLENGLTGLEFASGIPGTLGGAIVGNAGCYGRQIGEFLIEALVLRENGSLERLGPEDFGFDYRRTLMQGSGDVVLEATLRLQRGDLDRAQADRFEKMNDRLAKHPTEMPSAGSWFKNLDPTEPQGRRIAAGALLEEVGAKQMFVGGAAVFPKHANIIINRDGASCIDVIELADRMRKAVLAKFGVSLEQEVRELPGCRLTEPD
ncbi:MAG: UDP-N-acetylmuramate dehydrogenase [Gemmatimonadales bacterium]|nr:UDP-N-acetylmuramate dehydrogenase [Gemmatimonadales bacterium]